MGVSFYGNVKQNGQSTFIFDAIYSNRKEMEDKCQSDKVFVNRYVLVDYHYGKDENGNIISYDRYTPLSLEMIGTGASLPEAEQQNDENIGKFYCVLGEQFIANYYKVCEIDSQKQWVKQKYNPTPDADNIETGEELPEITDAINTNTVYRLLVKEKTYNYYQLVSINSNKEWQQYHFNDNLNLAETDGYHNNKMTDVNTYGGTYDGTVWMKIYHNATESYLLIGKFSDYSSPIFNFVELAPSDQLGMDIDYLHSSDLNYQVLYSKPWNIKLDEESVNSVGRINETTTPRDDGNTYSYKISEDYENNIALIETNSGVFYPIVGYKEIILTKDAYEKNKYYIIKNVNNNPQYIKAIEDFDSTEHYYIKTIINENREEKADTKKLSLNLPALGNGAIYLYDGLFGRPDGEIGEEGAKRPYAIDKLNSLLGNKIGTNSSTTLCLTGALELLQSAVNRWDSNTPQVDWTANYYKIADETEKKNQSIKKYNNDYIIVNQEYVDSHLSENYYIIDKSFIQNRPKAIGENAATILCQKIKLASTNFFYSTEES